MENGIVVQELLKVIENGPPNERWKAARSLVKLNHSLPKSSLFEMFDKDNVDLKQAVLFVVGKSWEGAKFSELIIKGLNSSNDAVFRTACETARNLRYSPVASLIAEGLKSKSIATVESSLRGLEYAWDDECFEQVFCVYKTHKSIRVKKAAAYPLCTHASLGTWKSIFTEFSSDSIDRHRVFACKIAYKFGDKGVLESLRNLARDKNGHVRWYSERTLKRLSE